MTSFLFLFSCCFFDAKIVFIKNPLMKKMTTKTSSRPSNYSRDWLQGCCDVVTWYRLIKKVVPPPSQKLPTCQDKTGPLMLTSYFCLIFGSWIMRLFDFKLYQFEIYKDTSRIFHDCDPYDVWCTDKKIGILILKNNTYFLIKRQWCYN